MTGALALRVVGAALCTVAGALIYLEAGAAAPPLTMPHPRAVASSPAMPPGPAPSERSMRLLFGGGAGPTAVGGVVHGVRRAQVVAIDVPDEAIVEEGDGVRVDFQAPPGALVGLGIVAPRSPFHWDFTLDGSPWPADAFFAGPYGLPAPDLLHGMGASCAHGFASGSGTPYLSADRVGAFVVCHAE